MDGILIVDKPKGMTSHDVVDFVRKRFGLEKVGHAGTLDPMATGVLVILIGRYTKSFDSFVKGDKEYYATLVLGATSDTGDAWGRVVSSDKDINLEMDAIEGTFKKFLGHIEQIPPMYSALKFKGRKLYEFARKGVSVERRPREVVIKSLDILNISLPEVSFKVSCSKGTYIRQLCVDIGEGLGCGAHLSFLRRTRAGEFRIEEAIGLEELRSFQKEDLAKVLITDICIS